MTFIMDEIKKTKDVISLILDGANSIMQELQIAGEACIKALRGDKKIIFIGNGGSAADAQHLAAELISRLNFDRAALSAIALTTDTSALTAIGNDYGFDKVFERQIMGLGQTGDVLIAISTSGSSPNILHAIEVAKQKKITVIGFTGNKNGKMNPMCDICLKIPSHETPKIQECHIMLGHILCGIIENAIFASSHV